MAASTRLRIKGFSAPGKFDLRPLKTPPRHFNIFNEAKLRANHAVAGVLMMVKSHFYTRNT